MVARIGIWALGTALTSLMFGHIDRYDLFLCTSSVVWYKFVEWTTETR